MGKTTREDERVHVAHRLVAVPDHLGLGSQAAERLEHVELAVGAREQDDADAGDMTAASARTSTWASSMTGLVRNRAQRSSTSSPGGRFVGGLHRESDGLADMDVRDVGEPERTAANARWWRPPGRRRPSAR